MERASINALMELAKAGDVGAFEGVARGAQDELFRVATALGLRREDAAEATQEALMRAYGERRSFKRGGDAMAWMCGIVVNVVREHRRKERRTTAFVQEAMRDGPRRPEADEEAGLDAEWLGKLAAALDQLPPRQREAIACRYLRRMSIWETAAAMQCAEGTVKSAVAGALEKLQSVLEFDHETR